RQPMPATDDNPDGYGESRPIVQFNNRLLESAGTRWNQEDAIPADWFAADARSADRDAARRLLAEEFPATRTFVLKDPRICRLVPFWRSVLATAGIPVATVLMLRDPLEVARSLAARAGSPQFRPAAIVASERCLLLWLRHVIDAERGSRGLLRHAVDYAALLADWRAAVAPLVTASFLAQTPPAVALAADALLRRRSVGGDRTADLAATLPGLTAADRLLAAFRDPAALTAGGPATVACDALAPPLDRLVEAYRPLRAAADPLAASDPFASATLAMLDESPARRPAATRPRTAVFLSGPVASIGHVYRVKHAVEALRSGGWVASWLAAADPLALPRACSADVVVAFRTPWDERIAAVAAGCRERGIPLVYDVDDLVFEPDLMTDGSIAILDSMPPHDRQLFVATAAGHQTTLRNAAAAILTTTPLAAAAARHCGRTLVLPNSLGPDMEAAAAAARAGRPPTPSNGRPRIVFASGTLSHGRDFAEAAQGIARLFARRPDPVLVIIGQLETEAYDCLRPFADRIECRPIVPLLDLFAELAGCDINLCPLELENPFCEAKSAVRWLFAAAVGLPSVATPTPPLLEAVIPERTGLLASDASEWEDCLLRLVDDAPLRARLAAAARLHALAAYGSETYRDRAVQVFTTLVAADPATRSLG
ncbi:MAG: glycosyltransferase, partial [Planctomycetota bacterium]